MTGRALTFFSRESLCAGNAKRVLFLVECLDLELKKKVSQRLSCHFPFQIR